LINALECQKLNNAHAKVAGEIVAAAKSPFVEKYKKGKGLSSAGALRHAVENVRAY
jgi:hypothetical protein